MPGYHLPYFAAVAAGIYDRHGIDVEIVDPQPGPDNVRAVAERRYDACLTSVAHFLRAKDQDPEIDARFVFAVARRTHMAAFVVHGRRSNRHREISSLQHLAGASFAGSDDSPFTREYQGLMRELELPVGELIEVPYSQIIPALLDGRADVTADFIDLYPRFESHARRADVKVRALPFYEAGLGGYGSGLVVGGSMIATRPEVVRALCASLRDSLIATRDDPMIGYKGLRGRLPGVEVERAVMGWRCGEPLIFADGDENVGAMDVYGWKVTLAHHAAVHGTREISPEDAFDGSFV